MKLSRINILTALAALCLATPTHAQETTLSGLYVGAKIGASIASFSDRRVLQGEYLFFDENQIPYSGSAQSWAFPAKTDTVLGGGVSLGYTLASKTGLPVRLELDYTARDAAEVSSTRDMTYSTTYGGVYYPANPAVMTQADTVTLNTFMANVWYDIHTGTALTPYIGGGIGWGFVNYKNTRAMLEGVTYDSFTDKKDVTNFAWSVGAGVSYALSERLALDIGYRYVDAGDMKVSASGGEPLSGTSAIASHDVMVGIRYEFGSSQRASLK